MRLYRELLNINLTNSFYTDTLNHDFDIKPTALTQKIFRNQHIMFRNTPEGARLLIDSTESNGDVTPFLDIDSRTKLSFIVNSTSEYLYNFTELDLTKTNSFVYRFSNLNDNKQSTSLLLSSATDSEYVTENDIFELRPKVFSYTLTSEENNATLKIHNELDELINSEVLFFEEDSHQYTFDFNSLPNGLYHISLDDVNYVSFYISSEFSNAFAIIDIYLDNNMPSDYACFDNSGFIVPKDYLIQFEARQSLWKYNIVLKYKTDIDTSKLQLNSSDGTQTFTKKDTFVHTDGNTLLPFESDASYDLKHTETKRVSLELLDEFDVASTYLEALPLPEKSKLKVIKTETKEIKTCSEIYIYI